jgi:hypothetical protein
MAKFPVIEPNDQEKKTSLPKISARQLITGTTAGRQVIRIKGAIIVNDGTHDRVLIGDFNI